MYHRYEYVALLDIDEVIMPIKHNNWAEMMDEDEAEVIEDDDVISSSPTSPRKRKKTSRPTKESVKRKKKKGQSESDDDFDPGSDSMGSASEEEEEEDDAQTDDNISDSDFMPGLFRTFSFSSPFLTLFHQILMTRDKLLKTRPNLMEKARVLHLIRSSGVR